MIFKNLKWTGVVLSLFSLSIWFGACNNQKEAETETTTETEVVKNGAVSEGLSFVDIDNKTISLNDLKGKVVFLNFWATWCPPCRAEMPSIDEMKKSFKDNDNIVFLFVDVDNKIEQSTKYVKDKNLDLHVVVAKGAIPSTYLGNAIPTTVVLDKNGNIAEKVEGSMDYNTPEVIKGLQQLMDQ